jgi:hypothetical protein
MRAGCVAGQAKERLGHVRDHYDIFLSDNSNRVHPTDLRPQSGKGQRCPALRLGVSTLSGTEFSCQVSQVRSKAPSDVLMNYGCVVRFNPRGPTRHREAAANLKLGKFFMTGGESRISL